MLSLSIITVNLNNGPGLQKTIESVVNQTYENIEFIIVDGNSTDSSIDIIKHNEGNLSSWLTEPDQGIYDAMNKGILKSTGEYLLFLNSGDYLTNNQVISDCFAHCTHEDILYGNQVIHANNSPVTTWKPGNFTLFNMYAETLPHSSSFIKRKLFSEIGLYHVNYRITSDYDFFLKAFISNKYLIKYINLDISIFNREGISSAPENLKEILEDRKKIIRAHFPESILPDYEQLVRYKQAEQNYAKYGMIWAMKIRLIRWSVYNLYRILKKMNLLKKKKYFFS